MDICQYRLLAKSVQKHVLVVEGTSEARDNVVGFWQERALKAPMIVRRMFLVRAGMKALQCNVMAMKGE